LYSQEQKEEKEEKAVRPVEERAKRHPRVGQSEQGYK
jgi:hypothetical protein